MIESEINVGDKTVCAKRDRERQSEKETERARER